ncbi:MAG: hypothetical protein ABJB76_04195 [Candidatus Nitrosocosmicus sp.]
MKATKEQVDEELMIIKLFASNYARDLIYMIYQKKKIVVDLILAEIALFFNATVFIYQPPTSIDNK